MRQLILATILLVLIGLTWAGSGTFTPAYPFDLSVLMPWHDPPGPFPVIPQPPPVAQFMVTGEVLYIGGGQHAPYAVVQMLHADGTITYQAAAVYGDANGLIFTAAGQSPLMVDPVQDAMARARMMKEIRRN